jgi:hypothetical protein
VRAGGLASDEQLAAIAGFFGVGPAFFGDDPAEVEAIADRVLGGVLRDCGILAHLICRIPILSSAHRRELIRRALHTVRSLSIPSVNVVPRQPLRSSAPAGRRNERPGHDSGLSMTAPMSEARIKTACQDLVHDLGIVPPFDPHELCRRLGEHRDRQIHVRVTDLGATTGVGHLVPKRRADYILVERTAPVSQQALVIYHEVIHLVRNHLEAGESLTCGITLSDDGSGSGAYADWREREAELGARMLSRERLRPNQLAGAAGAVEQSIAAAFGFVARERSS